MGVGGLSNWWSSLSVAEKRYLGAGVLGMAGIGVWGIALSRRDAGEDPEVVDAVVAALGELGTSANPNDAADIAYWKLYPECPHILDPGDATHDLCIDLWLRVRDDARFQLGCSRDRPALEVYPPGSKKQVQLFRQAARKLGVPEAWASSRALRYILAHESAGVVGIPNYLYGWRAKEAACWPKIWQEIRDGTDSSGGSTATGLGQLKTYFYDQRGNRLSPGHELGGVDTHYPSGRAGIGDPLEEAVGMLSYIKKRYGTPEAARACYGKGSKQAPCEVPGKRPKTFKEGY